MGLIDRLRSKVKESKEEGTPVYVLDKPVLNKPTYVEKSEPEPAKIIKPKARKIPAKPKKKEDFFVRSNRVFDRIESGIDKFDRKKRQSFGFANRGMDIFEKSWSAAFTLPEQRKKSRKKRDPFDLDVGF